jgi:hypothetical protein
MTSRRDSLVALARSAARRLAGTPRDPHRYERGQVLPVALVFMSIIILFAWFLIDIAGVQNVAGRAVVGSLRAGGLAALQERGTLDEYGRWYVCPTLGVGGDSCSGLDGDAMAREYVGQNLLGDQSLGLGGYDDIFGSRAAGIALLSSGTGGGGNDGLDVEILNPAAQSGQFSDAYLNGVDEGIVANNAGSYPECLESVVAPGTCYTTATIILRIRIPDRHVLGTFGTIDSTIVIKAGTDQ